MKHTGVSMPARLVVPRLDRVKLTVSLSKEAKVRLKWLDYYHSHGRNARLTARHFGIAHKTFYRYYQRFKAEGLVGLESRSQRPHRLRRPTTPLPVVDLVRQLRKAYPEYSKYKLAVILKRDFGYSVSASTIGRVISRYQLFFSPPVKPKSHPGRLTNLKKMRKPTNFRARAPGDLVEVDLKHLPAVDTKRYGFVAIDVVSKQASVHVAATPSARQAAVAWQKAVARLGLPKAVLSDNGSENLGAFAKLLQHLPTDHYFTKPHTPKDKPHVERFIGSLERECLQWGGVTVDLADQQAVIDTWLAKYHSFRPHQALGYLTPDEYKDKLRAEVAPMY